VINSYALFNRNTGDQQRSYEELLKLERNNFFVSFLLLEQYSDINADDIIDINLVMTYRPAPCFVISFVPVVRMVP